jgi:hypothetical protein
MGRFSNFARLGSKLVLEIMPSVAATVIGGYLLAQLHFARTPEPQPQPQAQQATVAPKPAAPQTPTVREDRAAMREVLKERRENPETPALVRPVVTAAPVGPPASAPLSAPASPPAPVTAQLPAAMDSIAPNEPIERAATPSRANVAAAPIALPRARPDTTASVYVPAPPPGLPQAPATAMDAPMQVAPAVVGTAEPQPAPLAPPPPQAPAVAAVAPDPPVQRGPVGAVLSTFSSFVGTAATATGHTVNWVIDLPGKAIEAGGRVIGVNPPPPPNRPFS